MALDASSVPLNEPRAALAGGVSPSTERLLKLLLNMGGSALARLGGLATTLIIVPISLKGLGPTYYGYLSTIISASILLAYADLGLSLSVVNEVAGARDRAKLSDTIGATFSLLAVIAMALGGAILVGGLAAWASGMATPATARACCIALLLVAGSIPAGLAQRILYAEQRNVTAGLFSIAGRVLTIGALLVCNRVSAGFEYYVYAIFAGPAIAAWVSLAWVILRNYSEARFSFRRGLAQTSRLSESLSYLALNLSGYFEIGIDNYLIGLVRGPAKVTNYDLLARVYTYIAALTNVLASPLWPSLRSAQQDDGGVWARHAAGIAILITAVATSAVSLVIALVHAWLIHAWTGYDYISDMPLAIALACVNVLTSITFVQGMALNAQGIIKKQALFTIVGGTMLVVVKLLLLASASPIWAVPLSTSAYYVVRIAAMMALSRSVAQAGAGAA